MSAVSRNVMPASSAASITARVPARSSRPAEVVAAETDGGDREAGASERVLPHPHAAWQGLNAACTACAPPPDALPRTGVRRRRRRRPCSRRPPGPGGVRWLQPVQRRRRRRAAARPDPRSSSCCWRRPPAAYAFVRTRDGAEDPSRAVAQRFADAWARGDLDGAWRLTTARTRAEQPLAGFKRELRARRAARRP